MADVVYRRNRMTFIWDEDKNRLNIKKHNISFYIAAAVFDDEQRIEFLDPEHSDDEDRYITIGLVQDVLTVVYCDRENPRTKELDTRIISARKATKQEKQAYNNIISGRFS